MASVKTLGDPSQREESTNKSAFRIQAWGHPLESPAFIQHIKTELSQFYRDRMPFTSIQITRSNLKILYGIDQAPSDTYLSERLDEVDLQGYVKTTQLLQALQRGKELEG
jgi:hypothetical protein